MLIRKNISILFSVTIMMIIMTPLNSYSGYLLIMAPILGILMIYKEKFNKKTILMCLLLLVAFVAFTASMFITGQILNIKNGIVMMVNIVCVYLLSTLNKSDDKEIQIFKIEAIDTIYYIIYMFCFFELLKYAFKNINTWNLRLYTEYQTFPYGYHHVDFSVITIFAFLFGMKRSHSFASCTLAIAATIILPSRTWQLFIILFILCWILKKTIWAVTNKLLLINSCFKWFLWLIGLILIFSFLWINVLNHSIDIVNNHEGLYDTSNYERFQSIWFSALVIIKEKLFIHGGDLETMYGNLTATYQWTMRLGPHNSFMSVLLYYSLFFGGAYLFIFSKVIDNFFSKDTVPYIIPYLLCGCILHDMFIGLRFMIFIVILLLPFKSRSASLSKGCKGDCK